MSEQVDQNAAGLVDLGSIETIDVLGPTVQFLSAAEPDNEPCVMRGIIPPGVAVPLHSHPGPETFIAISGRVEGLREAGGNFEWIPIAPGDVFHVPGWAKHAFRNRSKEPAELIVAAPASIGRFFREIGTPGTPGTRPAPPSAKTMQRFMAAAQRHGHWNATPEENARVGILLGPPA